MGSALALPNRSRRLVQQRKRAATDVSAFASGWRRHVRVFANISSVTGFLPEALATFLRDHPDIEVSLEDRITSDILHAIRTGAADIGLVFATVSALDLQLSPWQEDQLVALMRPDHPLAARLAVRFAELAVEPFLGLSGSMALQQLYRRGGGGPADRRQHRTYPVSPNASGYAAEVVRLYRARTFPERVDCIRPSRLCARRDLFDPWRSSEDRDR